MIECPGCKKSVSESAVACPSCGFPVAKSLADAKQQDKLKPKEAAMGCLGCGGLVFLLIAVGSLFAYVFLPVSQQQLGEFLNQGESPELHKQVEQEKRLQNFMSCGVLGSIMLVVAYKLSSQKN